MHCSCYRHRAHLQCSANRDKVSAAYDCCLPLSIGCACALSIPVAHLSHSTVFWPKMHWLGTDASTPPHPTDSSLFWAHPLFLQVYYREAGNISPRMAEMRADLGTAATDLSQYQAFDGPIPETVNGRYAASLSKEQLTCWLHVCCVYLWLVLSLPKV